MTREALPLAQDLKLPSKYLSDWGSPLNCCQGALLVHFLHFCLMAGLLFQEKQPLAWAFCSLRKLKPMSSTAVDANKEAVRTMHTPSLLWGQGTPVRASQ